jgi:hypothetical protein
VPRILKPAAPSAPVPAPPEADQRGGVRQLLDRVQALYVRAFGESESVRGELAAAGLSNLALLEKHEVGYCEGTLPRVMNTPDGMGRLAEIGICDPKGGERFKGMLVFPLHDATGAICDLWGLGLSDGGERLLAKTTAGIWNLAACRRATHLYVALTPLDGLALCAAQHGNVIAVAVRSGKLDIATLEGCGVQQLTLVVGESAAAVASVGAVAAALHPYVPAVITLSGSESVLAFLKANGPKALAEAIVAATHGLPALTFPGMRMKPDGFALPLRGVLYTAAGLERTRRSLRGTIRAERGEQSTALTLDFNQLRSRREFTQEMVRVFAGLAEHVEADLRDLQRACDYRLLLPDIALPEAPTAPVSEGDRREAELLGRSPDLLGLVVEDFHACGLVGEDRNIQLCFLAACSRRLDAPLAVMVLSSIGAGKSATIEVCARLCPAEEQVPTDYLSGQALFHLPRGAIKHKLLAVAEAEGADRANYAIRILLSSRGLRSLTTGRDSVTGKLQSEAKVVEGPVAMLITGSDPQINRETLSRFIVTSADESRDQTEAIRLRQREDASEVGLQRQAAIARVIRRHHAFQRLLEPRWVIVPSRLAIDYGDDRLCSRRDFPKVLGLVRAVAFARQMQKEVRMIDGVACIEADQKDLDSAGPLIRHLFGASQDELSEPSRTLLRQLHDLSRHGPGPGDGPVPGAVGRFCFTRRFVAERLRWSKTSLHRSFKELEEAEYIVRDMGTRQRPWRYFLDWLPAERADSVSVPFQSAAGKASTSP